MVMRPQHHKRRASLSLEDRACAGGPGRLGASHSQPRAARNCSPSELGRSNHEPESSGAFVKRAVERHQPAAKDLCQGDVLGVVGATPAELLREAPGLLSELRLLGPAHRAGFQPLVLGRSATQLGCGVPSSKVFHASGTPTISGSSSGSSTTTIRAFGTCGAGRASTSRCSCSQVAMAHILPATSPAQANDFATTS